MHHRTDPVLYADKDTTMQHVQEIAELGIRFIEPSGGNVLLVDWLPDLLQHCYHHELCTFLSLSGLKIVERLEQWGNDWLRLPNLVRFSVDGIDDPYRGGDWHKATVKGIRVASKIRQSGMTQIALTLVPGKKGNIKRHQFESVLTLAKEYGIKINLYPEFGTWFTHTKDNCAERWDNINNQELEDMEWFCQQPEVLPQIIHKLDFVSTGGNKTNNPTCKADRAVLEISANNKLIGHCMHNPYIAVPITSNLSEAITIRNSMDEAEPVGTIDAYCQGCWNWCYLIPSWIYDSDPAVWEQELMGV